MRVLYAVVWAKDRNDGHSPSVRQGLAQEFDLCDEIDDMGQPEWSCKMLLHGSAHFTIQSLFVCAMSTLRRVSLSRLNDHVSLLE